MNMINMTELSERLGLTKSTLRRHMAGGILPPGVRMGRRDLMWPVEEIEAIELARIALWSDPKLMMLVNRLMARRQQVASAAMEKLLEVKE